MPTFGANLSHDSEPNKIEVYSSLYCSLAIKLKANFHRKMQASVQTMAKVQSRPISPLLELNGIPLMVSIWARCSKRRFISLAGCHKTTSHVKRVFRCVATVRPSMLSSAIVTRLSVRQSVKVVEFHVVRKVLRQWFHAHAGVVPNSAPHYWTVCVSSGSIGWRTPGTSTSTVQYYRAVKKDSQ